MPKNLMTGQVFRTFKVPKFQQVGHFFTLLSIITHFLVKNSQKPNARAKFTSQNLMPGQKLTPEIPNVRARTSLPTFIRESPPPPHLIMVGVGAKYVIIAIFVESDNQIFTADLVAAAVDS